MKLALLLIALLVTLGIGAQMHWGHRLIERAREYIPSDITGASTGLNCPQLDQQRFLASLHAIVDHGNISDIAFLEKSLGVKFMLTDTNIVMQPGGNPVKRTYIADAILGQTGGVSLEINAEGEKPTSLQPEYETLLRFYGRKSKDWSGNLAGCQPIGDGLFEKAFSGGFVKRSGPNNDDYGTACKSISEPANEASLRVCYTFYKNGGGIQDISVSSLSLTQVSVSHEGR